MILFAVAKDASSFAMRISWLNFEPIVSKFPAIKSNFWLWLLELQRIVSWLFLCCWNRGRKIVDDASNLAFASLIFEEQLKNLWLFLYENVM